MQGLDSLTPAEVREWADLRGAMSNIDASRNLVLHRAQVTGGSEETTQEIVKIMGQVGISAAPGIAKGISKVGVKEKNVPTDQGPMLGQNGVQTSSKTIWKGVGKERIDVENPNPGKRPGQIHYQDNKNNKYYYEPSTNSFYSFDSSKNKIPAPSSVNNLLSDPKFKQAIDKGMKQYLGEK
ncbi:hypothetical protein Ppb6_03324 [Photorhabdus australis subsp. thailandensis]|uniref:Uncharacterized protein n=1 Tax=Photorhabdus australis subsp. thailandensis TaxID=2805096 RepID=A0A1C0U0V6_9GAMM|nr:hypothetical protein Ppb6_03324 [Photorhabdus australis subsp. thailandensis]